MSSNDQTEFNLPVPGKNKRASSDLLPRFFRTEANKKFLQATVDQLIQPGVVEKINAFYGRKNSKAYRSSDSYVKDISADRQDRQLEPAVVIKDEFKNVEFYKDYNDYVNQLRAFGANTENHDRLNTQETYPWNPNLDWDKFVNFREYYWVPNGPAEVPVRGQSRNVVSTYTVTTVTDDDNVAYIFNPNGFTRNPTLKLYRGQKYRFEIDVPGHPIAFSVSRSFTPGSAVIVAGTEGIKAPGLYGALFDGINYDTSDFYIVPPAEQLFSDNTVTALEAFIEAYIPVSSRISESTLLSKISVLSYIKKRFIDLGIDKSVFLEIAFSSDLSKFNRTIQKLISNIDDPLLTALVNNFNIDISISNLYNNISFSNISFEKLKSNNLNFENYRGIDVNLIKTLNARNQTFVDLIISQFNDFYLNPFDETIQVGIREYQNDINLYRVVPNSGSVSFNPDENVSTLFNEGISRSSEEGEELAVVYVEKGVIEFTIPLNAPNRLFYVSKNNVDTSGLIRIEDIEENTIIDVEEEIVGKKYYTSSNGIEFTNGLKVYFQGEVTPEKYSSGNWFIEGVGDKIRLVSDEDLKIPYNSSLDNFDSKGFDSVPFESTNQFPTTKEYLIINRASKDRNYWSRYNRWFHKDVLEKSLKYNELPIEIDESGRAKRPIIEFEAGLKLYNFGTEAKADVDLIDTFTKDVFSTIEGSFGYNIDGVQIAEGMRILFTADTDILVNGKIYQVKFIKFENETQLTLVETEDSAPLENETILVLSGNENAGKIYHYTGTEWKKSQEKLVSNQAPKFDLCCPQGNFYGDVEVFNGSAFKGTKLFSYKEGSGINDSELGFPLTYRNIENSGDILFEFNLLTETFTILQDTGLITVKTKSGNLRKYTNRIEFAWVNGWSKDSQKTRQKVLRQYVATSNLLNNFEIDVYDKSGEIPDLKTFVYVNNKFKQQFVDYEIDRINGRAIVRFYNDLVIDNTVLIKTTSSNTKNSNGWYDFPINLERNPLNQDIGEFTLGEVIDHVDSMVEDLTNFNGVFPGNSNLRDLGDLDRFGKRFVKHSSPMPLSLYHITDKNYNIVKSMEYSKNEYARFKRTFLETASSLGFDGEVKQHFDKILSEMTRDKTKNESFYFSDMLAFNAFKRIEYIILDANNSYYSLTEQFSLDALSTKSINVYLNSTQLLYDRDYTFNDEGFLILNAKQKEDDILEIYEYENTNGSYIPPTPTKLGLYPKFEPHVAIDDTYQTADLNPEFTGPFKIYGETTDNSLNTTNRGWFYPVYTSKKSAQVADSNNEAVLLSFKGLGRFIYAPKNVFKSTSQDNPQYEEYPVGVAMIKGHDGSYIKAYKDYRDNLLLELEFRIFNNIKTLYNSEIFNIHDFVGTKYRVTEFSKEEIDNTLLKDFVNWLNYVSVDFSDNVFYDRNNQFTFNYSSMTSFVDGKSLPGFWRGVYKEAYDTDKPHSQPWEMLGFYIKPRWWDQTYGPAPYTSNNLILWDDLEKGIVREPNKPVRVLNKYIRPGLTKHIPVDTQGKLLSPIESNYAKNFFYRDTEKVFRFGDEAPAETAWRRSSDYPFALIKAWLINQPSHVTGLVFDTSRIVKNLVGQYVYSDTQDFISTKNLSLPNTYLEDTSILTSGLVNYIYNLVSSDVLKVYNDYRNNLTNIEVQLGIKIAGFSDKEKFKLILDSKSPNQNQVEGIYVPDENYQLFLNTSSPVDIPVYSGLLFEKATDGFIVRGYNDQDPYFSYHPYIVTEKDISVTVGGISEESSEWNPEIPYLRGQILENNNSYYRVVKSFTSGTVFSAENLARLNELPIVGGRTAIFRRNFDKREIIKLPYGTKIKTVQEVIDFILGYNSYLTNIGFEFNYFNNETGYVENWDFSAREFLFWTTQGWTNRSTIALSPAAQELQFQRNFAVVDDIFDDFYEYSLKQENGLPLSGKFSSVLRSGNDFGIRVKNTENGIYNIRLPLVQKEHVALLDNITIFNDVIYRPESGFRRERIRAVGYKSSEWNGGLNVPGFIYDDAKLEEWTAWKSYEIGSLVKHKQFYYVAIFKVFGSETFDSTKWYRLTKLPESKLMANFDYKINQFADFYDLESSNFDAEQQKMAQHLIGYQKREYLSNIITDDVSQYKFYQGFIKEKGSKNALTSLFKTLKNNNQNSLEFYEDWAIQLGRYGGTDDIKQYEIILNEELIKESPQIIEIVDSLPTDRYDKIYKIKRSDLYDVPVNAGPGLFPTTEPTKDYLTGGYVNEEDIVFKASSGNDFANKNVNDYTFGSYIWEILNGESNWSVLQLVNSKAKATTIEKTLTTVNDYTVCKIVLDKWASQIFSVGEYVAIKDAEEFVITGFYKVYKVTLNEIHLLVPTTLISDVKNAININLIIVKLRNVRVSDLSAANEIIQQDLYNNQKFWVDNYSGNNKWAVVENNSIYNEHQTIDNPESFELNQNFASVITATKDNLKVFVSSPKNLNGETDLDKGRVYSYARPNNGANLLLSQTITHDDIDELLEGNFTSFGETVSVSEDGEYLAIGVPSASNVKTKFKGEFNKTIPYNKGDVVKYKEKLWKAVRDIVSETVSQSYNTFRTFNDIEATADDSTSVNLLLSGNVGIPNSTVNHILVRAPLDQYLSSRPGDVIKLKWNLRTVSNLTSNDVYPWNREKLQDTNSADFISNSHIIAKKVDRILLLRNIKTLPTVGSRVYCDTGNAEVQYVSESENVAVVYLSEVNGDFELVGKLSDENDFDLASYSEELTYSTTENLGGYWYIETYFDYNTESKYFEQGNGLVYVDLRVQNVDEIRSLNDYYNIQDNVRALGENNRASLIEHLSYIGNPDNGALAPQETNVWLFRVPENYVFETTPGSTEVSPSYEPINLQFNNYDSFDFTGTGFTTQIINKKHTVVDIWDGYIDFRLTKFITDPASGIVGNPFEIQVGDVLEDVQILRDPSGNLSSQTITTSQVFVKFVQKVGNSVRVYVKNKTDVMSGNWTIVNNTVGKVELRRKANVTLGGSYTVDRIVGEIFSMNDDVFITDDGLVVVNHTSNFSAGDDIPILDQEYSILIYRDAGVKLDNGMVTTNRVTSSAIPTEFNRDYQQVFNIEANLYGTSSFINQGVVVIYKNIVSSYKLDQILVSEYASDNQFFGKKVKITQDGGLYKLFVYNQGDKAILPSFVEVFVNGFSKNENFKGSWNSAATYSKNDIVINLGNYYKAVRSVTPETNNLLDSTLWLKISWSRDVSKDFTGEWNVDYAYNTDEIVVQNNSVYRSLTNISEGQTFEENNWEKLPAPVEYSNKLPGTSKYTEFGISSENIEFVKTFDTSQTGSVIVTANSKFRDSSYNLSVFKTDNNDRYVLTQNIETGLDSTSAFAEVVSMNPLGNRFAISESASDEISLDQGRVHLYFDRNGMFEFETALYSPNNEESERFGSSLSYGHDNLIVSSLNGDMKIPTTFDVGNGIETTFDKGFTLFKNIKLDTGVVYVYEEINNKVIFAESFKYPTANAYFGEVILSNSNFVYIGIPKVFSNDKKGLFVDFRKTKDDFAWKTSREIVSPVDVSKIKSAFLYNRRTNQIVSYLDFIDPVQSKIAGPSEQELSYKTGYDPASYNIGESNNDVYWAEENVGKLWWNTRTAKFKYPYTGNKNYQKNIWNEVQTGFSINVYEWVESDILPEEWDAVSNTDSGYIRGISGISLYGNTKYSQKYVYDVISKTFSSKYYFWVEFKRIVPNKVGRTISSFDVANLISSPRTNEYKFLSLIGENSFILNNCNSLIQNDDIVLNIRYSDADEVKQNTHSQYQLVSDGLETSLPHPTIERKWFDSLIGFDEQLRTVPNMKLTVKNRYGIQNRPRQSMFVNRIEALKQYFERVNGVLKNNIIVDNYDISDLQSAETKPSTVSKLFDVAVSSFSEIQFISTNKISQATVEPIIVNGKISSVRILHPGRGYTVAPSYKINGTGSGAVFETEINNLGQLTNVKVFNSGKGYDSSTNIVVRRYSVLVENDETVNGKWTIYHWEPSLSEWQRSSVQDYDVTTYWDYIDWYDAEYNSNTAPNFIIEGTYEINSIDPMIGDIVKIKNVGAGGWLLLLKIANENTEDYTVNYSVIGKQNGTIQFKDTLWDYNKNLIGFSSPTFDNTLYDNTPNTELRIIFASIRDKIFTKNLKVEYNKLFIASLRYVLSEQLYVDWMFKTSFIKAKHNLGELEEDITFNNDNLSNYESYIDEVKPYKTTVREFVSAYNKIENTNSNITDFDLSPYWDRFTRKIVPTSTTIKNGLLEAQEENMSVYPRLNWLENYGQNVKEVQILDGGTGYLSKPTVKLEGGFGEGAKAEAFLGYGRITAIKITNPGKNYVSAPRVIIEGPQADNGTPAKVSAVLNRSMVRTPSIKIKFDRISGRYAAFISSLAVTETFVGTNVTTVYKLEWPMEVSPLLVSVTIDGKELFRSQYKVDNVKNSFTGYTRNQGKITFTSPPPLDSEIVVTYQKALSMLDAEDRIRYGYKPTSGMFSNSIEQLMTGVDYGGVEIRGLDFGKEEGWDTDAWYDDNVWDNIDYTTQDLIFKFDGSTIIIDLEEPLAAGIEYNVYLNGVRIDDPDYGTESQSNDNAVMTSLIGNGETRIIDLDNLGIKVTETDVLIIRKTTSDGSDIPDPAILDTAISGGELSYTTATGLAAEDIIIDGDGFVTATTSGGPEELVPGQVMDTLDIQVYTTQTDSTVTAYRQFKDILNRTHYKHIDAPETVLAKDLNYYDVRIEVIDGSVLASPNKERNIPGVIFVNKERIEYFVKDGNLLRQIRRGTLGTGIKDIHPAGTEVFDQSLGKNIAYKDRTEVQTEIGDGTTNTFRLGFTASTVNEFEVFVAGYRMNKSIIKKFDPSLGLDSTKADVVVDPDFALDSATNSIVLKTTPLENQRVLIIRKIGRQWTITP